MTTLREAVARLKAINARLAELQEQRGNIHAETIELQCEAAEINKAIDEGLTPGIETIEIGLPPTFTPGN
jgi:uncharacterized coiled-coil DUF342 family protein